MKKVIVLIAVLFAVNISAQSKYEKGMTKAFKLWEEKKEMQAAQLFERISKAEKDNWLPPYYAATIEIISSFGLKDEAKLNAKLTRAQEFLDDAKSNSPENPEIMITQALLNTAYIAFDGQKYGMTLSMKNTALYEKALKLAPENPRVVLSNAEWKMGSAKFFGQSTKPYCKEIKQAIELGKKEEKRQDFYPIFMLKRAEQVLKRCEAN